MQNAQRYMSAITDPVHIEDIFSTRRFDTDFM
jgi:hypothetical protein